jgi:hypothetical protein
MWVPLAGKTRDWCGSGAHRSKRSCSSTHGHQALGLRCEAINVSPWPCGEAGVVWDMEAAFPRVSEVVREAALGAGGVIDAGLSGDPGGL